MAPVIPDITLHLRHPGWKKLLRPYCKTVREVCVATLTLTPALSLKGTGRRYEMAVVLADDELMRELNRDYRGKDKPTNVLSFPSGEYPHSGALGDIILGFETVEREAIEQQKKPKHHAMHLLAHGTLHLLGYDHEREKDAARMEEMEIKILKKLGVANPYL